ncbi:MAG: aminotransferase class V-fold PLP-dependent enzyme, partial [Clostridiales bacterium]|nr:aminotransferase class V-fold PLP-dependent enzyme [Clostridiales bacterium]
MIYADNAATTKMSDLAIAKMVEVINDNYGNPSSLYRFGQRAKEILETAREEVASVIGAEPREILFTSGGSEADNQAIRSAALIGKEKGKTHIISTKFEHHAVLHTLDKLEKEGFEITLLDVHEDGLVRPEEVAAAITDKTALVTIMYANNEIGTIQPIAEIGKICHEKGVLFHTDAVQAITHVPINVVEQNIDMLSASGHKFHGPKGTGFLYARKGIKLSNLIEGGAQERGKRAGTENVPGIAAMAVALKEANGKLEETAKYLTEKRNKLIAGLSEIEHSALNGDAVKRLPSNVNFCFEGIEGESLLLLLDEKGIAASSGSACTSGSLD